MDELTIMQVNNKISYLRARDPSLLAGILQPHANPVRLVTLMDETGSSTSRIQDDDDNHIKIYLRIKKSDENDLYQVRKNVLICNGNNTKPLRDFNKVTRQYTFSHIFPSDTDQEDIFTNIVKQKVLNVINGDNASILTYGASGSGKTFTIIGTESQPGVIPRSLEYIFRTLPDVDNKPQVKPACSGKGGKWLADAESELEIEARQKILLYNSQTDSFNHMKTYQKMQETMMTSDPAIIEDYASTIDVWISFAEIYNETIFDLLVPDPKTKKRIPLKVGSCNKNNYIKNLNCIHVTSGLEAYEILQYGLTHLNYAATSVNSHSSRSHCIFTIKLVQSFAFSNSKSETIKVSQLDFCDLAGTERSKKTMNVGVRLKESNNINNSLVVLGRCINILRDSEKSNQVKIIPFRESKLTQLLQMALTGRDLLAFIVTINPIASMLNETTHVLNFSAVAKDVVVKRVKVRAESRFSQFLQGQSTTRKEQAQDDLRREYEQENEELRQTVADLEDELRHQKEEHIRKIGEARAIAIDDMRIATQEATIRWQQRMQDVRNECKSKLDEWNENPKRRKLDSEDDDDGEEVICVDTSSDEDDEDSQTCTVRAHASLYTELFECQLENQSLKEQFKIKLFSAKQKIDELKEQYREAELAWDLKINAEKETE